ncbi:MAG TPA: NepR family anti-sigma factor [Xanthobacteraceae bacterium]|nr:NepR family anti-sigma factor [Xanthobacteraceae bacterium]
MTTRKTRPPEVPLHQRVATGKVESTDDTVDPAADATLGREIQAKIGLQLRTLYNDIVSEGVPDRFVSLLGQLEKKSDNKGE